MAFHSLWQSASREDSALALAREREIFRPVITHSSFGFVLVHNHPSASVHPSAGDVRVKKRIAAGARMLKINFLDHVIVGQAIAGFLGYFSFHEAGLLRRQNKKTEKL